VIIHAQCGADRYRGAEKMIVRGIQSLPHSLIDNPDEQLGKDAVPLIRYVKWLKKRIRQLGAKGYQPAIHLDLHGGLGAIYQNNLGKILGTISALEKAAQPYPLRIESPLVLDSREEQIQYLKTLREYLRFRKMNTQLVADEWADTLDDIKAHLDQNAVDMIHIKMPDLGGIQNAIEAVLVCKENGVGTLLGGSCAETDLSARMSAQVALAVQPDLILAKPGMGVDEGIAIIANQMSRVLAQISQAPSK
jgi:methylaspartate ammonia-lyase